MPVYKTQSPILFLIFNRPDTTLQVFEKIKEAKPSKLYIAADGPRPDKQGENILCQKTQSILHLIDWPCQVKTLFRSENLGCKYGVSSAIDWFFEQEEEGIILEDDCLPSNDFFRFCDELLNRYRNDTRIIQIAGCNVQLGKKWGNTTYYFSNNVEVWGWATWRRVWKNYDVELKGYRENDVYEQLLNFWADRQLAEKFKDVFIDLKQGKIDTWDYQLKFQSFFNNGLCVIPNVNLISNIGFRADGTHTFSADHPYSNIPLEKLDDEILHPQYFIAERAADFNTLHRDFGINAKISFWEKLIGLKKRT